MSACIICCILSMLSPDILGCWVVEDELVVFPKCVRKVIMDMFCVIYYSDVKYQHALFCRQMCFSACCYLIHQVVELQRKDRLFSLNQKEKINQRYMLHDQRSFDNQWRTDQTDLIFGKRKYEVMFSHLILLNLLFRNLICYLTHQVVQLVQMQLMFFLN